MSFCWPQNCRWRAGVTFPTNPTNQLTNQTFILSSMFLSTFAMSKLFVIKQTTNKTTENGKLFVFHHHHNFHNILLFPSFPLLYNVCRRGCCYCETTTSLFPCEKFYKKKFMKVFIHRWQISQSCKRSGEWREKHQNYLLKDIKKHKTISLTTTEHEIHLSVCSPT